MMFRNVLFGILIATSVDLFAQEDQSKFEIGITGFTLKGKHLYDLGNTDYLQFEYFNGLFSRYKIGRWAVRGSMSYFQNNKTSYHPISNSFGTHDEVITNYVYEIKDLRIGLGAQFALLHEKEWIYSFGDISYRRIFENNESIGGFTGSSKFKGSRNGIWAITGIGLKLTLLKKLTVSPEIGYVFSPMWSNNNYNPEFGFIGRIHITYSL